MGNDNDVQTLRRMSGLVTPMALRVAVTLGLPDRLRAGPASPDLLATELDVNPRALELLLGHLVTLGIVERAGTGYRTTEFGEHLCADADNGLHNLLRQDTAAGRADLAFVDPAHSIRTGEPAYPLRYGRDFWADLAEQPHLRDAFDRQMTWRLRDRIPQFVAAVDWSRFRMIVDVGGGPGDLLAAVLDAHAGVCGHLVDLEVGPALRNFSRLGDRARRPRAASSTRCRKRTPACSSTSSTTGTTSSATASWPAASTP
ncbi:O-methyltransferase [Lentzea atacamensis]|uniref:O-methyltransferase n=1 Tax=Lentzea atacamensis TaxID=531938 RepID=A0ABX9E1X6_9PSEU|nr:methyltransferase [Lentzea atacamensis]RAS62527.1 O-methyltransferase [Lentzea atacamensis]